MRILYHIPFPQAIYAGRTIFHGYKNAFTDLGHTFRTLTANDDQKKVFAEFQPDLLMISLVSFMVKYLDLKVIAKYKKRGLKVFVNLPFWKSPLSRARINEEQSLSQNGEYIQMIRSEELGSAYYNICEPGDQRMEGFEEATGFKQHTIPLAADQNVLKGEVTEKFQSDISYVGTNLPEKRWFFKKNVFPLKKKYTLRLYGQDWTYYDQLLGWVQKFGQYFNIPVLRSIQKAKLALEDEAKIYASSIISINVHEQYQRQFGGDCNERTFKIPLCNGFEITDDVACIHKYFKVGEEIIVAENEKDWIEKINFYIKNPEKRLPIIQAGKARVLKDHTYHQRVKKLLLIFETL